MNIDSPKRHHVNIGKRIKPVDDPINRAAQTELVASTIVFQAYQKAIEVGTPIVKAAKIGFPFHQSDKYCAFN